MDFRSRAIIATIGRESTPMSEEIEAVPEPKRRPGRPRRARLDDDDGLLNEALKVQTAIMLDKAANTATRGRAATAVQEIIATRAARRNDEAKAVVSTENSRLQAEIDTLAARVKELQHAAIGKVDASEVTSMKSELARLRSETQQFSIRQSAMESERDAAKTALRYAVQALGGDTSKTAMRMLIDLGPQAAKSLLPMFGVESNWAQFSLSRSTKDSLLEVFRNRTSDRETELTSYARLRLSVEFCISDVEEFFKQEERRRLEGEAQFVQDVAFVNIERRLAR
jgi:hypothetical protein